MRKFKNLIVDLNNLVFTTRFSSGLKQATTKAKKEKFVKEMLFKDSLTSILFHSNKFSANGLLLVSDSKNVWRRDIYPDYKGNKDPSEDIYFEDVIAAIDMLIEFFTNYTAAQHISVPRCEGDDIIGFWCLNSENVENIILSSDSDYIQLVSENTSLYSPAQGKFRESDDPQYDLFLKCIRGDRNDAIPSAFPKVRESRIKSAWNDDLEMLNLLNEKLPDGRTVMDALDLNMRLIDLAEQPTLIKQQIEIAITNFRPAKYDEIKCMQFFNNNNLKAFNDITRNGIVLHKPPVFKMSK